MTTLLAPAPNAPLPPRKVSLPLLGRCPLLRYPQRRDVNEDTLRWTWLRAACALFDRSGPRIAADALEFAQRVQAVDREYAAVLAEDHRELRNLLSMSDDPDFTLVSVFAAVASASRTTLGLDPHPTQLAAARVLLGNYLAEMATGEGKTLVVGMTAAVAALYGWRVHVMTANDYLAQRDAQRIGLLLRSFGLSTGCVQGSDDEDKRRLAYRCQVVYATAKEIAFDWLRDRVRFGDQVDDLALDLAARRQPPPILTGLPFALVDEADSILLDEARTPLILATLEPDSAIADARFALQCAQQLKRDTEFTVASSGRVQLTPSGEARLKEIAANGQGSALWRHPDFRHEQGTLALQAMYGLLKDRDYILRDDEVLIVDPNTGRVADGRRWSRGLHRLVELKEGLTPGGTQRTLAAVSYQRFFPRYLNFAGISGTLRSAAAELRATYRKKVVPIPLHQPLRRVELPPQLFADEAAQLQVLVHRTQALVASGQPVLIGTATVVASEQVAAALSQAGIAHVVLNARQDADEAAIVAQAGTVGRVTVSTAMAGRGTDIALAPGAAERGGLAVLVATPGRSARIYRQLAGRAGRHGDPGRVETFVSTSDELLLKTFGKRPMLIVGLCIKALGRLPAVFASSLIRLAQALEAWRDWSARRAALRQDLIQDRALGIQPGADPR